MTRVQNPHIHMDQILEDVDGDIDIFLKLCRNFLYAHEQMMRQIKSSIENKNFKEIEKSSHSLKGVLLNMRANRIADQADKIEMAAFNHSSMDEINGLFHKLMSLMDELIIEINQILS